MELKESKRKNVKLKIGISGASGFGKTMSALQLAFGMTQDWSKIAVIDTENSSASLYSHLGNFNVLDLKEPYTPERYIKAIEVCENAHMEVIIIDSISHEWSGSGGCLQIHEKQGGRFQDWAKITPRHQSFIDKIVQCKCHIITTTRRKIDYSLDTGSNGRTQVVKHGTKEITRDGYEYELTVNFELVNENHLAKASKDRTGLFMNQPEFLITPKTGIQLLEWCNQSNKPIESMENRISRCVSLRELIDLYKKNPEYQKLLKSQFQKKKNELEQFVNQSKLNYNGINTNSQK